MPTPSSRPSLKTDLESRYRTQRAGSAFDVKTTLKQPDQSPRNGDRMPINGNERLYSVDDFAVKQTLGITEFLDATSANSSTSPSSLEMSRFMRGFTNRKYKP
jgi:hypothetical protein